MANKPEEFPIFTQPDPASIMHLMAKIPQFLHNVTNVLQIKDTNEILVCEQTLYEIISRVEKRRVYFHVFHNGLMLGELNEAALICFWILKLMPFKHNTISNSLLNTKIAYTFFVNILFYVAPRTKRKVNVKKALADNLLYAFQYRDLSKEAIMALAESLLY